MPCQFLFCKTGSGSCDVPNTNAHRSDFSADYVRSLLSYDPPTGIFRWLVTRSNAAIVGAIAGTPHGDGYVLIGIDGQQYLAHRLAWLYMTGEWPKGKLDHRDRVRNNNIWTNIRAATNAQNSVNSARKVRDLPRGVHFHHGKYVAQTTARSLGARASRNVILGRFTTPEAAHQAWRDYIAATHGAEFIPE